MLRSTALRHGALFTLALLVFSGVLLPGSLAAQTVFRNPDYQYIVDIPVGWEILDGERTDFISFTDPDRVAVFQIIAFPGNQFVTADELERYVRESYGAAGDKAPYRYFDQPAVFADYRFTAGQYEVRGYMAFLNREEYDFAVMTFVPEDYYEQYHDAMLSGLDSFSPDTVTRNFPGPVSQFFGGDDGAGAAGGGSITLPEGTRYDLPPSVASEAVVDASQTLIEREARVLSAYAPGSG
jgi:hypothetical protein